MLGSEAMPDRAFHSVRQTPLALHSPSKGLNFPFFVACLLIVVLLLQIMRTIEVDAYELTASRTDLLGYLLTLMLGLFLIQHGLLRRRVLIAQTVVFVVMFFYIAFVMILTDPTTSLTSAFVSRYGFFPWFWIGMSTALAIEQFAMRRQLGVLRWQKLSFIAIIVLVCALAISFSFRSMQDLSYTRSYQSLASNAMTLILILLMLVDAVSGQRKSVLLMALVLTTGTYLVSAIALLQSTSIVAFWFTVLLFQIPLFLGTVRFMQRLLFVAVVATGTLIFVFSDIYELIVSGTRFRTLFDGSGQFSPLESRLLIFSSFEDQFAVSPIFGNFRAEVLSGAGSGNYVHSIPLSMLSHTGLIGFSIMTFGLVLVFLPLRQFRSHDALDQSILAYAVAISAIGSLFAFMTWPVFWFMLGAACKRPLLARMKRV
ncbi:hypothetical protein MCELHM10_01028 [Paracoccaceae bacterium]